VGRSRENFEFVLDNSRVIAGFSNRFGGVSKGIYASLNLAFHVGDERENVSKNREILAQILGVKAQNLIFLNQIHSSEIFVLDSLPEALYKDFYAEADAVVTNQKNAALCVMMADCAGILIYDPQNLAIAAVHAGRAGVIKKILTKTVKKMGEIYGSNPQNLELFISPNIAGNCYEIGDLNLGEFNAFKSGANFSLNSALKAEISALGIKKFHFSQICTHCDERFFSYRRDGATGRFCGAILLI